MSRYWLAVAFFVGSLLGTGGITSIPVVLACTAALTILAIFDQRERARR